MEQIEKFEREQEQIEGKFALFVVGAKGHGKSSFCRMIVTDSERPKVQANIKRSTGRFDSKIYNCNRFNNIFWDDIVVIDTPGYDSKETISLIAEDIENLITKHKLQIAGLAYVIDMMQSKHREQLDYIFHFMSTLKVKYCHKNKFSFCILSKFDQEIGEEEQVKSRMSQFQIKLKQKGYDQMWKCHIRWMSSPLYNLQQFYKKINGRLMQNFQQQYSLLHQLLKTYHINKQCLSHQSYASDKIQFEADFISKITPQYVQEFFRHYYQNEIHQIQLVGRIPSFFEKLKTAIALPGITIVVGLTEVVLSHLEKRHISTGSYAQNLNLFVYYSFNNKIINSKNNPINSGQKNGDTFEKRIRLNIKKSLQSAILKQAELDGKNFIIESLHYITSVKCFDEDNRSIEVRIIRNQNRITYNSTLKNGRNRIKIFYKIPCINYEAMLREQNSIFYNKRL